MIITKLLKLFKRPINSIKLQSLDFYIKKLFNTILKSSELVKLKAETSQQFLIILLLFINLKLSFLMLQN